VDASCCVVSIKKTPMNAAAVYARIRVRGVVQDLFRCAVRRAYEGRCASCGFSFEGALDAVHIVPWRDSSPEMRLSPANGLLLCTNHHRLFDTGMITLTTDGRIEYFNPDGQEAPYTDVDRIMTLDLHGRQAQLPERLDWRPSVDHLRQRHGLDGWELR
jgi:putative restriction endonuclease